MKSINVDVRTSVCLSIFSDFLKIHTEWANEKGTGWSPSYTVQTVLLNMVSFLMEMSSQSSYYEKEMKNNIDVSKSFKCAVSIKFRFKSQN